MSERKDTGESRGGKERGDAEQRARRKQKRTRGGPAWKRVPFAAYFLVFAVVVLGLAVGLPRYLSSRGDDVPGSGALAKADIGQKAPAFSLKDQSGQTYTFTPGDGKPHVLVFYMGYF